MINKRLKEIKTNACKIQEDSEEIDIRSRFFLELDKETIRRWYLRDAYGDEFGPYDGLDEQIKELNQRISESIAAFRFFAKQAGIHLSPKICELRTEPETLSILSAYRKREEKTSPIYQAGVTTFNAISKRVKK